MFLHSYIYIHFKTKSFFWFGLLIGILFSFNYTNDEQMNCDDWSTFINSNIETSKYEQTSEIKVNLSKKPLLSPKKIGKTVVRPRYYSTELGIREKLFVGVLTSFDNLNSIGIAINITLNHNANKIKYFVQALHNQIRDIQLNNVVGFTDNREAHRPFHIFKYISDNFIQEYDYFYLMSDKAYINGLKLKQFLNKISITEDVYTGIKMIDSSYCSLDGGILFSNSVIKKIKSNLEWCVKNAVSNEHSDNIGRCTVYAIGQDCQTLIQGQQYTSFKAKFLSFKKHLKEIVDKNDLNTAISVYPVVNADDMYVLHSYFAKQTLIGIQQQIEDLRKSILKTVHLHPPQFSDITWPIGDKRPSKPVNRYDLQRYDLLNTTHCFMRDDFTGATELHTAERNDIQIVLDTVVSRIQFQYGAGAYKFRRLVNAYRRFDPSCGLNYILDIGLKDMSNGKEIIKRMEVTKTLGQSEILPVPYVTENSRVTIILSIKDGEQQLAKQFISSFADNIMQRREKTFLMLTFLYGSISPSKGDDDIFVNVKKYAQHINDKIKTTSSPILSQIAWVSIRFPFDRIDRTNKYTLFAIIDLTLRKIGLEALILHLDVYADIKYDFLNRVRMNTIVDFQSFFPIPFAQFDPNISGRDDLDINKNVGQFDLNQYNYFSIYARDYVKTRRKTENKIPIVRTDKDIAQLISSTNNTDFKNLFEYLIKNNDNLHYFRAVEPSLKIKYHFTSICHQQIDDIDQLQLKTIRIGSKVQLAKLIFDYNTTIHNKKK